MIIKALEPQEISEILGRLSLGRIACAKDSQPYIVPLHFMVDGDYLYDFTTLGRKIEWMRANPKVCVAFDEIHSSWDWTSVVILGTYQELVDEELKRHAFQLLERARPLWWEPGYVRRDIGRERKLEPIYFRISIDEQSGHRGVPEGMPGGRSTSDECRFSGTLSRVFHWAAGSSDMRS